MSPLQDLITLYLSYLVLQAVYDAEADLINEIKNHAKSAEGYTSYLEQLSWRGRDAPAASAMSRRAKLTLNLAFSDFFALSFSLL
jgi:hypothetical protein